MKKTSKRIKNIKKNINLKNTYNLEKLIILLKNSSKAKFDESIDIAINLGINSKKSDQNIRGTTVLPNGIGRSVKVAVFAEGTEAQKAKEAGADLVGMEDLIEIIKKEGINFNTVIATPNSMKTVTKLGHILGPRGLIPNPKLGTVTTNIPEAIKKAKTGQVIYRNDKNGIVHAAIGRVSFESDRIKENFNVFLESVKKAKPPNSKGIYIKKIVLSTTMGIGLTVDLSSLSN